jgi:hypothetical protein
MLAPPAKNAKNTDIEIVNAIKNAAIFASPFFVVICESVSRSFLARDLLSKLKLKYKRYLHF